MKRLLVALLVAIAAAVVALFVFSLPGGPLNEAGNGFGGPVQAGHPFTAFYELRNDGDRPIEVRKVSLGTHSGGLVLLGARAQTGGANFGATWPGFPSARTRSVPAKSFVLRGHGSAPLLIGLRAERTGDYFVRGVDVEYRVRFVGKLGPRYRRTLTTTMAVCAQRRPVKARTQICQPPEIPE